MGIGTLIQSPIRTAVLPVAGYGTRMLPATRAVRKEMLPVGRKPLIQHAVEEARASGIEHIVFVCRPGDRGPLDHFEPNPELEQHLRAHGRTEELEQLVSIGAGLRFSVLPQNQPLGLADAIRAAAPAVAGESFAVLLPDALMLGPEPCLAQLIRCCERHQAPVVATRLVAPEETRRYGILDIDPAWTDPLSTSVRVRGLVEKPAPDQAPSLYGIYGRYVLPPDIFEHINNTQPDSAGEIQLTDALHLLCQNQPVYGALFRGDHYDTGSWKGYAQANLACFSAELGLPAALCGPSK